MARTIHPCSGNLRVGVREDSRPGETRPFGVGLVAGTNGRTRARPRARGRCGAWSSSTAKEASAELLIGHMENPFFIYSGGK